MLKYFVEKPKEILIAQQTSCVPQKTAVAIPNLLPQNQVDVAIEQAQICDLRLVSTTFSRLTHLHQPKLQVTINAERYLPLHQKILHHHGSPVPNMVKDVHYNTLA